MTLPAFLKGGLAGSRKFESQRFIFRVCLFLSRIGRGHSDWGLCSAFGVCNFFKCDLYYIAFATGFGSRAYHINMYARLRRAAPPPHGDVWGECLDASRPVARPSKIQMRLFLSQLEVNSPINFFRWRGQVFYGGGNR